MRYVIDADVALRLAAEGYRVREGDELLAPTLLRSHVLSAMHEAAHRGELSADDARERVGAVRRLKIRLLGDAVLQRVAWGFADELGWPETYAAEYLALTKLQADAFVTLDDELARAAAAVVPVAPYSALVE